MECNVCGGKRYVCIDGFYYCAVCSTQSQTQVEYLAEETLRKSHLCEEVKTKDERCTSDQGAVTAPSELTFFSEMLCEQSEVLIQSGFDGDFKEVVFYLLLLMLKKSEKQKNHENDDEELSEALSVMAINSDYESSSGGLEKVLDKEQQQSSKEAENLPHCNIRLKPVASVVILYSACIMCGYSISIVDLLRMFRSAKLPLYNIAKMEKDTEKRKATGKTVLSLHCSQVFQQTCEFFSTYDCLNGSFNVFVDEIIVRFIIDLNLPKHLISPVRKIISESGISSTVDCHLYASYSKGESRPIAVETKIMAAIVILLKLIFGIDDCSENILSEIARKLPGGASNFSFFLWVVQCKMRYSIFTGGDPKNVFRTSWCELETYVQQLYPTDREFPPLNDEDLEFQNCFPVETFLSKKEQEAFGDKVFPLVSSAKSKAVQLSESSDESRSCQKIYECDFFNSDVSYLNSDEVMKELQRRIVPNDELVCRKKKKRNFDLKCGINLCCKELYKSYSTLCRAKNSSFELLMTSQFSRNFGWILQFCSYMVCDRPVFLFRAIEEIEQQLSVTGK